MGVARTERIAFDQEMSGPAESKKARLMARLWPGGAKLLSGGAIRPRRLFQQNLKCRPDPGRPLNSTNNVGDFLLIECDCFYERLCAYRYFVRVFVKCGVVEVPQNEPPEHEWY